MKKKLYNQIEKFLKSPAYFFVLIFYVVLALFATNIYELDATVLWRPLLISIVFGLAMFFLLNAIFRSKHESALMATTLLVLFATYGYLVDFLGARIAFLSARGFALFWLGVIIAAITGVTWLRRKWKIFEWAPTLNLVSFVLLLFPLFTLIRYAIIVHMTIKVKADHFQELQITDSPPDIYYIILDSYTRSDVYLDYGYDNSSFISDLEALGFYVVQCSQSNYGLTALSLTSALNLDYLPAISEAFSPGALEEPAFLYRMLHNNVVRRSLEAAGYKTVSFASGFVWSQMSDADVFFEPPPGKLNEFEVLLLKTTFGRTLSDFGLINLDTITARRYRDRTLLLLDSFEKLSTITGPKFVFMHFLTPHPPYVFTSEGDFPSPENFRSEKGYADASAFISNQLLPRLKSLIENSSNPPVIIIQGDHGPLSTTGKKRVAIINAYYLPDHAQELYPTITPINSFRVVFNAYFGSTNPLLPDTSFDVMPPHIYTSETVPNECSVP